MGQTLTHGIYLPDEGERNCYSGLASNWSILDGAVGTIAEHTTALAGKAPAVHTHTKSDITDFPAYGNAAGTICEGNDSRLSDARTPVAHTHTKSDVTDLFNSANTWTGGNSFSKTLNIYNSDSSGTTPALHLKSSKSVRGTTSASETDIQKIAVLDKNENTVSENITYVYSSGSSWVVNAVYTTDSSDNVISSHISHYIYKNGRKVLRSESNTDLGTSTNPWNNLYANQVNTQSVNSINPGALSLPDCQVTQSIDRTGWVYDGATYNTVLLATTDINMTKNGWLYIRMTSTTSSDKLTIKYNSTADRYPTNTFIGAGGSIEVFVPVVANTNLYLLATKDLSFCKFYPCLGNVPSGV